MSDNGGPLSDDLFGGDSAQKPGNKPAHAAPKPPLWGDQNDALTEILPVEDIKAELNLDQAILDQPLGVPAPLASAPVPAPTRVFDDWRLSTEGEGYVPAVVGLDKLQAPGRTLPAKQGWRGSANTMARLNLAPGKDERYEMALKDRVQRMLRATFPIAVMGVKGGVGKTVVTEVLGSTFSAVRGDRVIAIDLDPDAGNLISRHGRETALSITDLIADESPNRYLNVRAHTSQDKSTRLEVLTGPDFAMTPMPLLDKEVEALMPILDEHYSLVLMDTGTGLKTNLMTAVLRQARALVMVSSASIDSLEETQVALDWLRHNGYQRLLETMVLVINNTQRGKPNINLEKTAKQLARQLGRGRVFVMPFDPHIFEGRQITLELLSPATRRRYLELAAALSQLFA